MKIGAIKMRTHRVAVVVSHPIQHFCPQYYSWSRLPGVELRVIFASRHGLEAYHDVDFNNDVKWNLTLDFDHVFLPGAEGRTVGPKIDAVGLEASLEEFNPDAVICYGYCQRLQRRAIRWATRPGKKLIMISDSELRHSRQLGVRIVKSILLPRILARADYFLTVGDANEAYLRRYGVGDQRFVRSFFPVDCRQIDSGLGRESIARDAIRQRHDLEHDAFVVLTVGKLVSWKRQLDVVRAVGKLREQGLKVTVLVAGTGSDEASLREAISAAHPRSAVLLGFVSPENLVEYYVGADTVFVNIVVRFFMPRVAGLRVSFGRVCVG